MNKKLMITTTALLLALTSIAGCEINSGGGKTSSSPDSSSGGDSSSSSSSGGGYVVTYCTVTFDLNYQGAPAPTTVEVETDDYIDEPEQPTRDGFYFNYWSDSQDGSSGAFDFYLTSIEEDITLYANWTAAYNVTFHYNKPEATEDEVYQSTSVRANALVTKPADPKVKGFTFGGWFKTASCLENDEFVFATPIVENTDLYAKWNLPDWNVIEKALEKYLSYLYTVEGVRVPKFPNSDYKFEDGYRDCIQITAPDKCMEEYIPVLTAAGYTYDEGKDLYKNDFVSLRLREYDDKEDQFEMLVMINGAGESTTFNDVPYKVGTQQNYVGIPASALDGFTKFETYRVSLTTGDPAALVDMYFDAQPADADPKLSDEDYWKSKEEELMTKLKAAGGYSVGKFINADKHYFIDSAYLAMNQIESFDASAPLKIELLSYSYYGLNGAGTSINKVDKDVFANAVSTAPFKTSASLDIDFSSAVSTYAYNGKNFIFQYDADTDDDGKQYIEVDVVGIKGKNTITGRNAPLNALATVVVEALQNNPDWDIMENSGKTNAYQKYYAIHYGKDDNGNKAADARLDFTYEAITSASKLGFDPLRFEIILSPVSGSWDAKVVADYFKKQALNNDPAGLPDYTGAVAYFDAALTQYGDGLDIFMLHTNATEANAYVDALQANGYTLVDTDAETGIKTLRSASTNFELSCLVNENSFEIYVNAAPVKERAYNDEEIATLNSILNARSAFTFSAAALATLTANYTGINYSSYYDYEDLAGYSVVQFVSDSTSALTADVTALYNYYVGEGWTVKNASSHVVTKGPTTLSISSTKPTGATNYVLQVAVAGNVPQPVEGSDGHCFKYTDTLYYADNGDEFIISFITAQIKSKYDAMENSQLPSFYQSLADKSIYLGTTLQIFTNLESYDIYYYYMSNELVDETAEKTVIKDAADNYIRILKQAGYKHGFFTALTGSPEGYWNEASGEFACVDTTDDGVSIKVFFIGTRYRDTVEVDNA